MKFALNNDIIVIIINYYEEMCIVILFFLSLIKINVLKYITIFNESYFYYTLLLTDYGVKGSYSGWGNFNLFY